MDAPAQHAIPASTLRRLATVPADRPVALLLRHSVREDLPPGDLGYGHPITPLGARLAGEFGALLRGRLLTLHSSPLQRCLHTAEQLRAVSESRLPIVEDRMLGDPGAYVLDKQIAADNWLRLGSEGIMARLVEADGSLPGTRLPDEGAHRLVRHMLDTAGTRPGLHVFVSHDILVAITAARFVGAPTETDRWPRYLEGAFFWRDDSGLNAAYRDIHRGGIAEPR